MILFSKLYGFFASLHRKLYSRNLKKSIKLKKFVISVGNISFGGTGKTPFVLSLVNDIFQLGLRPAIIARSYKGHSTESKLLSQEDQNHPEIWGDEACLYSHKLKVPVYSGPKKWKSAMLAEKNKEVEVIIVDDGFQHHKLSKDLNIVLVDALAGQEGLMKKSREPLKALNEADAIILTRSNLVSEKKINEMKALFPSQKPLFLSSLLMKSLKTFEGGEFRGFDNKKDGKVGLVSGIASPESFSSVFKKCYPQFDVKSLNFEDHHIYNAKDLVKIEKFKNQNNLDFIVMTEKDEIKIKNIDCEKLQILKSHGAILRIETRLDKNEAWLKFLKGFFK
jgi:tetraacyldisaccharide 4'-kinase